MNTINFKAIKDCVILLAILLVVVSLTGCASMWSSSEEVTAYVIDVYKERSPSCKDTIWHTVVRTEDGRVGHWCGRWGEKGDPVKGTWKSGYGNAAKNGFKPLD